MKAAAQGPLSQGDIYALLARQAARCDSGDSREEGAPQIPWPRPAYHAGHRRDHWHGHFRADGRSRAKRSEEHTSELQSLMRISYAVFCLKKKNKTDIIKVTFTK